MASALTARHIGGAVNYVSVAEYGGAAPELVAAGIAARALSVDGVGA